jgi:hypothetical protein
MAMHIRCLEVHSDSAVLYAILQYGPVIVPAATKKDKPSEGYGVKVRLSRRLNRKGSVEQHVGVASLNFGGELVRLPEEAELSDFEIRELERQIKELAA